MFPMPFVSAMVTAGMRRSNEVDLIVQSLVPDVPGAALIAVGGYGREDLFPYSASATMD